MNRYIRKLRFIVIKGDAYTYIRKSQVLDNLRCDYVIEEFNRFNKSGFNSIDKKIRKSNDCYAVIDNSMVIHQSWIFMNNLLASHLGMTNYHVIGNCITHENFRGRGIYPAVLRKIMIESERDLILFVDSKNKSSIQGIKKAGFNRSFNFKVIRIFGICIYKSMKWY